MRETHVIAAQDAPNKLNVIGEAVTIFGQGDSAKPFEVHLQEGVKGGGPPPHHHAWDEAFYVLEGEVAITIAEHTQVVGAGSYVHIPANTVHAYENLSTPAKLLAVVSDTKGGEVFQELDQHVHQMPDDHGKLIEISKKHGVTFIE